MIKKELSKKESSNLVYKNFNFNKFNISDEEIDEFSDDARYNYLEKFFMKFFFFQEVKT